MLPFESYNGFESYSNQNGSAFIQQPNLVNVMDDGESVFSSASNADVKKSTESCNSHKEAERRRRQRINAHLSTLRTLLPNTTKTDKASLLEEAVSQLKKLKRQAADLARQDGNNCCSSSSGSETEQCWPFPGELDEATMSYCGGDSCAERMIKVSVCCQDRPGLNRDLTEAIRSVRAKAVQAEMMTVGGRTKSTVMMQWRNGGGGAEDIGVLKRALKAVVDNGASGSGLGLVVHGNKRSRVLGLDSDGGVKYLNGKMTVNLLGKGQ